jgi:hypothetical protein
VRVRWNLKRYHVLIKNLHNLKNQTVRVILSTALTSRPLSECAEQSVNLILSKYHSTVHPHSKTLFSLLSLSITINSYFVVFVVVVSSLEDSHLVYHHWNMPLAMDIMMVEE